MQDKPLVVDLSHWDTVTDWQALKDAGIVGVLHKFSQGVDYLDPSYPANRTAAKNAGLLFGRYHFGDNSDVAAQVAIFLLGWTPDEALALDFEENGNSTMTLDQARDFLRRIEQATGVAPIFYGGSLIKECLSGSAVADLADNRLWLAQYGDTPECPAGWSAPPWLWQYTDTGSIAGVSGPVDLNYFDGSADELRATWCGAPIAPAPGNGIVIEITAPPGTTVRINDQQYVTG